VAIHLENVNKKLLKKIDDFKKKKDLKNVELYSKILKSCGGYFVRPIAGTTRWSTHSYGIAMDINIMEYWAWSSPGADNLYHWKNIMPMEIIDIFESEGFIWGGKWYHFDPMHFEYRPELLHPECVCHEQLDKSSVPGEYLDESKSIQ
jgi:hypothetical protein